MPNGIVKLTIEEDRVPEKQMAERKRAGRVIEKNILVMQPVTLP